MMTKGYKAGGAMGKTCPSCPNPAGCKAAGTCAKAGKGYKAGGKLQMVEKGGKKVPFYAADGKGKMKSGGKVQKMKSGGKVRGCGMARGGAVRKCKMVKMKGS